jgi:alkylation response protein AidB-like acyl-CoA dehydrogenase
MALWPAYADKEYVESVRTFVREWIDPHADAIDRDDIYPVEIVKEIARRGLSTVTLPEQYGGGGKDFSYAVALLEEVAYSSPSVAICLITIFQASTILRLFGQDSLRDRYLPQFRRGLLSSYALTEANHGSDIRTLDTKAVRDGDEWVITGEKQFITGGAAAEFFIILAETEIGVSAMAVPGDAVGLGRYVGERSATFGLRNGPHVNVVLDKVRVPADHLIGIEGKGVRQAVTTLNYSRTLAAGVSLGIARAAFDGALRHAKGRVAFDQRVVDFQGIQWYFADMLTRIDAARLLVYKAAAESLTTGVDTARFGSEAKLMASTLATEVASTAVRICGVHGVSVNSPFGRYLRDAQAYEVGGGSVEILRNTIGKYLSKDLVAP